MKKHFILFAAAALMTCACSVEPVDPVDVMDVVDVQPEEEGEITVLTAGFARADDDTRTVRQADGKVFWSPGDAISVFRGTAEDGHKKFVTDITEPAPTADFKGVMPSGTGAFWAVYPYREDNTFDGSLLGITLPAEQEAVAGSFADNLFPSVAYVKDPEETVSFHHVFGGLKFTLVQPGIERVTLIPASSGFSAGRFYLEESGSGQVYVSSVGSEDQMSSTITLCAPEGETLKPGEAYHLVMRPTYLLGGFTLMFERKNGTIAYRKVSKSVLVRIGSFVTMQEVDRGLDFEDFFEFGPSSFSVDAEGGLFTMHIRSSGGYHVDTSNCDWIEEVRTVGDPHMPDGADIYFSARPNTGGERSGVIIVCNDGAQGNCYPVTVSQAGGEGMKRIVHHSLALVFSATWCVWCPPMDEAFALTKDALGDRFDYITLYDMEGNYGLDCEDTLYDYYWLYGYPSSVIDGRKAVDMTVDAESFVSLVESQVSDSELFYPAVTSVALSSTLSGKNVTVNADVYANVQDDYKITVFLVENGIIGPQSSNAGVIPDFHHERIARLLLTDSATGDAFTADAGETMSFTFTGILPADCNAANMEVVAYVQRRYGSRPIVRSDYFEDWYVDNCRNAALGASAPLEVE